MTQPDTDPRAQRMVTIAEACEQLCIGKTSFYKLVHSGEIAVIDVNATPGMRSAHGRSRRSIRIEQSEIDAFVARQRVTVPA